MCNMEDYIQKSITRLNEFLPTEVNLVRADRELLKWLPMGLMNAFDYYEGELAGVKTLFAGMDGDLSDSTPKMLERQKAILNEKVGLPVVFIFPNMPSYLFSRYVKRGLNIIVGNKHLFLPDFLLIVGKDTAEKRVTAEVMPTFSQLIILYHLEKMKLDGMTTRQLTSVLGISYASVNRALRWLLENDYINLTGSKEKKIEFKLLSKDLWLKSNVQMSSPIDFRASTTELWFGEKGYISGEHALSEYSMLNGGSYGIAISKEIYKEIRGEVFWDPYGEAAVEIWKYDPAILSEGRIVDKLSLYLSLRDNDDDRVQIELENMINEIKW